MPRNNLSDLIGLAVAELVSKGARVTPTLLSRFQKKVMQNVREHCLQLKGRSGTAECERMAALAAAEVADVFEEMFGMKAAISLSGTAAQRWISKKIRYLVAREGRSNKQAVAIAYSMARKKGFKV
jgi:hypothetical protein